METQAQYEARALTSAMKYLDDIAHQPLADRREARTELADAMANRPQIVAERIDWCIEGAYGYGEQQIMLQIVHARRGNRAAQACQLIGALEWQCPQRECRMAWNSLTNEQQISLNAAILAVLDSERDHAN